MDSRVCRRAGMSAQEPKGKDRNRRTVERKAIEYEALYVSSCIAEANHPNWVLSTLNLLQSPFVVEEALKFLKADSKKA